MSVDISLYVVDLPYYLELWEKYFDDDPDAEDEWLDLHEELEDQCDFYDGYRPVTELIDQIELKRAELEGTPEERFLKTVFWQELKEPRPGLEPKPGEITGYAALVLDQAHLAELSETIRNVDLERLGSVLYDPAMYYLQDEQSVASYLGQFLKTMRLALESGRGMVWAVLG